MIRVLVASTYIMVGIGLASEAGRLKEGTLTNNELLLIIVTWPVTAGALMARQMRALQ